LTVSASNATPRTVRASVLFANISGFSALSAAIGPERAYFATTGLLNVLDGVARRHGGAVDKYMGDALLGVFGHPLPLERPAVSTLAAALEMRRQAESYRSEVPDAASLELTLGVNTGEMVVGDISGPAIREFHVLGDAVNVAARINARAPLGGLLAGPETVREAGDAFDRRSMGTFRLKGKSEPIEVFEIRGARSGALVGVGDVASLSLVGRDAECASLQAMVQRAARGERVRVALSGPPRSGRSRLLAELESITRDAGIRSFRALGSEGSVTLDQMLARAIETAAPGEGALALLIDDFDALSAEDQRSFADPETGAPQRGGLLIAVATRAPVESAAGFESLPIGLLDETDARALVDSLALPEPLDEDSLRLVLERGAGIPEKLVLAAYAAPALRQDRSRQAGSDRDAETERRRATILFADITGFTRMTEVLGAERAYPVVARCLALLDEVARKHGGTVEKYLGDCLMALFGVPDAIEDAPRAAVNAAIEMRRRVRALEVPRDAGEGLDLHCGIHTGLGISGDISGPLIREFAVMGDPVTVADGLKDRAPSGAIYVGDESRRFTAEFFEYAPAGDLTLRGSEESVPIFELRSDREQLGRARLGEQRRVFAPLVGRDEEQNSLRERMAELGRGHGGIVSLVAGAGLGKSRLLAELRGSEAAREMTWLEGVSLSTGQHTGYHSLADLLRRWSQIGDEDSAEGVWEKLAALIRSCVSAVEIDDVLPFVAVVAGVELPPRERARIEGLAADALENLILSGVTRVLRGAGELRPLVVVMDDLHWADHASIALLQSLLRLASEGPILFVNVFRPGYETTSESIRRRVEERWPERHTELRLSPLDADASRALLHHLFRPEDLPHATRRLIEEKSGGNPFYIEEVVRALVDAGAVEHSEGRFRATEKIASFEVPGSIQEVVTARLDALPRQRRRTLQTAAVIGPVFHLDVLREVSGRHEIDEELQDLMGSEFLVESDRLPGEEFAFKHPLLHEIAYEGLLEARREEVHRAVGHAIEAVLPETLAGYSGMLALHFSKGREHERAEEFLFRAGAEAARAAAPGEALDFFQQASRLYLERHGDAADPARLVELERNIASALYYRGRFVEAIEHYNEALALLGDRSDRSALALGLRLPGHLLSVIRRLYLPFGARQRPATDRDRAILDLRYARAEATVTAEPTRHFLNGVETLARVQRLEPRSLPGAAKMYAGAVGLFAFSGLSFALSRRLSETAAAIVDPDDESERLYERVMRFVGRVFEGDWAPEHEIPTALVEAGLAQGQPWGPTTYLGLYTEKQVRCGDFSGAAEGTERIGRIWDLYQYDLAKANFLFLQMLVPLEQGRYEEAIAGAVRYYDECPEALMHLLALGARAKAETLAGRLGDAEETLARADEVFARASPVPPFHASWLHVARLRHDLCRGREALARGERPPRRSMLRSVRAARRSAASVAWWRPEVDRLSAGVDRVLGRHRHGWSRLASSVEEAERLGARLEVARGLGLAARWLNEEGPGSERLGGDAPTLAGRARAQLEALGLSHDGEA
jgi:class 3 adenylate cyclase/tetratricopeptide (TPR) repeat protein